MVTNGDEIKEQLRHSREELVSLSRRIYTIAEINSILAAFGTKLELFFKSVLFPSESPWRPLKFFIDCLGDVLSQDEIQELQQFREIYNLARHNPRFQIGIIELLERLERVETLISVPIENGIGRCGESAYTPTRRVYWVTAWKYFDDMEVHIIVPGDADDTMGPPELDMIRLDRESWERAKQVLSAAGSLDKWEAHVPETFVRAWEALDDFVEAIAFEGEYRELLTSLAKFENNFNRMPGTNRGDCSQCVLVACLVAMVDVISATLHPDDIVRQIQRQVSSSYAVPETARELGSISAELARIAESIWDESCYITGPLWASHKEFEDLKTRSLVSSDRYPVLIDDNHRLIALSC